MSLGAGIAILGIWLSVAVSAICIGPFAVFISISVIIATGVIAAGN